MARTKGADGKRKEAASSSSKTGKRARVESNTLEVIFRNNLSDFNRFVQKYQNRWIVKGKSFKFGALEADFEVCDWLRYQGWETYVSYRDNMFPRLVRSMICNLNVKTNKSWIGNTEFNFSEEVLRDCFNIPEEEEEIEWPSRKVIFSELAETDIDDKQNFLHVSHLNANLRMAYLVVINNVYPRRGATGDISEKDAKIMWALKNKKKINLARLMMEHIILVKSTTRFPLPYGMALTRIFRLARVIRTDEEEDLARAADSLDLGTLKRLGFKRTEEGWISEKPRKYQQLKESNIVRTAEAEQELEQMPEIHSQVEHVSEEQETREEVPSREEPGNSDVQESVEGDQIIPIIIEEVQADILLTAAETIAAEEVQSSHSSTPPQSPFRRSPIRTTPQPSTSQPRPSPPPSPTHPSTIPDPLEARLIAIEHFLSNLAVQMHGMDHRLYQLQTAMIIKADTITRRLDSIDARLDSLQFIADSLRHPQGASHSHSTPHFTHFPPPPQHFTPPRSTFTPSHQPQTQHFSPPRSSSPINVNSSSSSSSSSEDESSENLPIIPFVPLSQTRPSPSLSLNLSQPLHTPPVEKHSKYLFMSFSSPALLPTHPLPPLPDGRKVLYIYIPPMKTDDSRKFWMEMYRSGEAFPEKIKDIPPEWDPPLNAPTFSKEKPIRSIGKPIKMTFSEFQYRMSINKEVFQMFLSLDIVLHPHELPFIELSNEKVLDRISILPDPPFTPKNHTFNFPDKDAIIQKYTEKLLSMLPIAPPLRTQLPPPTGPKNYIYITQEEYLSFRNANLIAIAEEQPIPYPELLDTALMHTIRLLQPQQSSTLSLPPPPKPKVKQPVTKSKPPPRPRSTRTRKPPSELSQPSTSTRKRKPRIPPPKVHQKAAFQKYALTSTEYQARLHWNEVARKEGSPIPFREMLDPNFNERFVIIADVIPDPSEAIPTDPLLIPQPPKKHRSTRPDTSASLSDAEPSSAPSMPPLEAIFAKTYQRRRTPK